MKTCFILVRYFLLLIMVSAGFSWMMAAPVQAQNSRKIVQLTGIVARGDSVVGVPGVAVGVLKSNRRTVTDSYGYFSLPVLAGDSVAIRFQGQVQYVHIPAAYPNQSYSVIVQLNDSSGTSGITRLTSVDLQRRILNLKLKEEPSLEFKNKDHIKNLKSIYRAGAASKD